MPRTLFARLLTHSAVVLVALLAAAAFSLDWSLADREVESLELQLARHARMASTDLPPPGLALQEVARRRAEAAGVRLTVIAGDGVVLADSDRDPAAMENHADRPEVITALGGETGSSLRRSATLGVEMLYVAVPGDPVIRTALPLSDLRSHVWQMRRRILLAALPAAVLALALAFLLSRALTRRFSAMASFAARLASGDYEATLPAHGDDELADLERSLATLREELGRQVGNLRRDRQRLATLVDGLPDGVVVLDGSGNLALANQPARKLLRLGDGQTEGLQGTDVLREPRILEALDEFRAVEGKTAVEPFRVSWPEPPSELDVILRPLPDEAGRPGVLAVLRDVTRQAHLERVRTDFIANLSHELRTPLTAIRGAAETLLDGALADPEAAQRFLETIRRHSRRLEILLADVSELARIEAGGAPSVNREFDPGTLARQVLELFQVEADQAGVTLEEQSSPEPLRLVSDPDKVESILVNLLQNAIRYTPSGGRVVISVEEQGKGILYAVKDTGIGIPPQDLPRVTERFYRVEPSRSRAQGGTGLGLSIVRHQVQLLGGNFEIESEYRQGTRMRVFVPSLDSEDQSGAPTRIIRPGEHSDH